MNNAQYVRSTLSMTASVPRFSTWSQPARKREFNLACPELEFGQIKVFGNQHPTELRLAAVPQSTQLRAATTLSIAGLADQESVRECGFCYGMETEDFRVYHHCNNTSISLK